MPANTRHPLFRIVRGERAAETRGDRDLDPGETKYDAEVYTVHYRTRPGGPLTTMEIKAESSSDARKIAIHRGVQNIERVTI